MKNDDSNPLTKPIAYPKQFLISDQKVEALRQEDKVATTEISAWLTRMRNRDETKKNKTTGTCK